MESLESLSESERQGADVNLLTNWYKCDSNGIPESMILTVSSRLILNRRLFGVFGLR